MGIIAFGLGVFMIDLLFFINVVLCAIIVNILIWWLCFSFENLLAAYFDLREKEYD